jgi:polysaccharide export outer membrane protein
VSAALALALLLQAAPVAPAAPAPVNRGAEYQVGPGDVLEIAVYGNDDLSRIPTVQTNGAVTLPLLGDVQVAGLTVAEIQRKITSLLAKDYLVNPQVEVKVREYQSQFVSVVGEVNTPGRQPLRGRTRLIDALTEAKGFTPRASGEVTITRTEGTFEGGATSITVRLSNSTGPTLQDTINLSLPLRNGDMVGRPGRYAIEADLTVTGAISLAGGLTRFGSNTIKVRRSEAGKVSVLEVDLKDVRNGKKPDVPLLPNDVISVGRRIF